MTDVVEPQAAPNPVGTPGLPVPAAVGPANAAPVSPAAMTVPFPGCGVLVPLLPQ
jgi:hypothetical protein